MFTRIKNWLLQPAIKWQIISQFPIPIALLMFGAIMGKFLFMLTVVLSVYTIAALFFLWIGFCINRASREEDAKQK